MIEIRKNCSLFLATLLGIAALAASPAFAGGTIKAELWDKGGDMMAKGMGMGMHADMKMATMGVKVDRMVVSAGKVTLDATNTSKETIHEMLVSPLKTRDATLPYVANEERVDEDGSGHLGEISELESGQTGSMTLNMKPGFYALYCNIPGHYVAGMWTVIEVK